jgi:hypothetical protein
MNVKQFDSLNTSYVNLAALLRFLRKENFSGSIHLALVEYEAEIFLVDGSAPAVFERDRVSGVSTQAQGAIERVLVHAREPGGTITVHQGKTQPGSAVDETETTAMSSFADQISAIKAEPGEEIDWDELLSASGAVIAAVERALFSVDADFGTNFRAACIGVGDDYPFLDPTSSDFAYASGQVTLSTLPSTKAYVAGISESLRRLVNKLSIDKEGTRFRERVAVELAVAARLRPGGLGEFKLQLDRIAGTRVL